MGRQGARRARVGVGSTRRAEFFAITARSSVTSVSRSSRNTADPDTHRESRVSKAPPPAVIHLRLHLTALQIMITQTLEQDRS